MEGMAGKEKGCVECQFLHIHFPDIGVKAPVGDKETVEQEGVCEVDQ